MKVTVDEAREYFAHPSQHAFGLTEKDLPEDYVYYATDGVCLVFHGVLWPGVWACHVGVKPEAWGKTAEPARRLLAAFWHDREPEAVISAIHRENRLAIALAKRAGGMITGSFGGLVLMEWRP